ncbi:HAD family hydrolase [Protofrankia symbiont of Coriaria ruscifolia]|uniref:HAD family hydrolase n=1 Tax=Protofrankia symbiont of Coriaria ruscifolia TaxID=1306542 RepID=UPI001040F14F|nr:HAD family phosphatase [Protofrankia symbiont of Coriaria ruscifolia]
MIRAAVFDCDGVLVDSERINNEVLADLATRAGIPTSFADSVHRYMGRSTPECVTDMENALGCPIGFDLAAEYERLTLQRQRNDLQAVPGVRDLLDRLAHTAVPVCVASSGTPDEITSRLAATGLAGYFGTHCYSASAVAHGKPAPDVFLLAAEGIGVDPADCVLIEDSPYGVQGGKAAGMTVIGYATLAAPSTLRAAGADHIVTSMAEVSTLLETMIIVAAGGLDGSAQPHP